VLVRRLLQPPPISGACRFFFLVFSFSYGFSHSLQVGSPRCGLLYPSFGFFPFIIVRYYGPWQRLVSGIASPPSRQISQSHVFPFCRTLTCHGCSIYALRRRAYLLDEFVFSFPARRTMYLFSFIILGDPCFPSFFVFFRFFFSLHSSTVFYNPSHWFVLFSFIQGHLVLVSLNGYLVRSALVYSFVQCSY